jgi:hypothetical protein
MSTDAATTSDVKVVASESDEKLADLTSENLDVPGDGMLHTDGVMQRRSTDASTHSNICAIKSIRDDHTDTCDVCYDIVDCL